MVVPALENSKPPMADTDVSPPESHAQYVQEARVAGEEFLGLADLMVLHAMEKRAVLFHVFKGLGFIP